MDGGGTPRRKLFGIEHGWGIMPQHYYRHEVNSATV